MTRDAYFKGFLQSDPDLAWYDRLQPYDWNRRNNSLPQIEYSKGLFFNTTQSYYIKGSNLLYLSVNPRAQNAVAAYMGKITENELFKIERINGDTIAVRAGNGLLFSINNNYDNLVSAIGQIAGPSEKFILEYIHEGNNLIALKSMNNYYISMTENFPYTLHANAPVRGRNETFRIYISE